MTQKNIEKAFVKYVKEYQDLNGVIPQVFPEPPTPLEFLQKCVHPNRPALIKGGFDHWPANKLWTDKYLSLKMKDQKITVAVTPNGQADAVTYDTKTDQTYFAMPYEEQMTFDQFLTRLDKKGNDGNAYYISLQNGSLPLEYSALADDIDPHITWCSEALGRRPDAVNFWFGDARSVTSLHKDPYENCYAVLRGEKTFILFPPSEAMCLYESSYPGAIYTPSTSKEGSLDLTPCDPPIQVPWIPVDPLNPDFIKYPRFKYAKPMVITVRQGEMLYLPSLWFHHVSQAGDNGVIAVNYWYDMDYQPILFPSMGLTRRLISELIDGQPSLDINDYDDDDSDNDD